MKSRNPFIPALGVVFALMTGAALSADVAAQSPRTVVAHAAGDPISRAERAVTDFLAACASHDAQGLHSVTTSDVRIEYMLDDPGTYLSMEADSLIAECAANAVADNSGSHVANLRIFPTGDANAVFVQYDAPAGSVETMSHRQLALVEMRGDRISRILNFAGVPPSMVASTIPGARN